jgi:hypothetical protein
MFGNTIPQNRGNEIDENEKFFGNPLILLMLAGTLLETVYNKTRVSLRNIIALPELLDIRNGLIEQQRSWMS